MDPCEIEPAQYLKEEWLDLSSGRMFLRSNRGPAAGNSGTPLVFVHGLVVTGRYMTPVAGRLAGSRSVYVPDLPGYGKSEGPREVEGPRGLADRIAEMLDALNLERVDFLGNSYGCQVLTEFAILHPARVRRMIFVGPSVDPMHRTVLAQFWRLLKTAFHEHPKLPPLVAAEYLKAGPRLVAATLRHCLRHPMAARLPEVRAPVLVVRGSLDAIVDQRWAEEVARLLPNAELRVMPGAGHAPNFSQPEKLAELVQPFFGRDGGAPGLRRAGIECGNLAQGLPSGPLHF